MKRTLIAAVVLAATALSASTFAQSTAYTPAGTPGTLDRDIHQQDRIEQGLQNGTLTTREGAQLERDEARINATQARDMRDGNLSLAERARLDNMQDRVSRDIHDANQNGVNGNPMSASSQRLQADVQRNVNQQTRIENGIHDGSLTTREASRLEGRQAYTDAREYAAGRDGRIGRYQQRGIQRQDNRQSGGIWWQKHDAQHSH